MHVDIGELQSVGLWLRISLRFIPLRIGLKEPLISLSRLFFLYVKLTKNIIKLKGWLFFLLNFYCSNKFNGWPFYRSIFTVVINSLSL